MWCRCDKFAHIDIQTRDYTITNIDKSCCFMYLNYTYCNMLCCANMDSKSKLGKNTCKHTYFCRKNSIIVHFSKRYYWHAYFTLSKFWCSNYSFQSLTCPTTTYNSMILYEVIHILQKIIYNLYIVSMIYPDNQVFESILRINICSSKLILITIFYSSKL